MKMFKFAGSVLFITLLIITGAAYASVVEQTVVRTISYDPHPSSAEFPQAAPFKGQMAKVEAIFKENWKTVKDNAYLQDIELIFRTTTDSGEKSEVSSKKIAIGAIKKGQTLETLKNEELTMVIVADDLVKKPAGVTDLTLSFKLTYSQAAAENAASQVSAGETDGALSLARKMAEKAMQMPDANAKVKIALLKRSLSAAPEASTSPAAKNFHDEINASIAELEGISPAASQPATTPDQTQRPIAPKTSKDITPEAKELLKQARSLFAQDKGPDAREALRKALEIQPDYRDALVLLAENAYENRRYARAKEAYEKAIEQNDRDPEILLKLFKARYYMGEGTEAVEAFQQISDKYPQNTAMRLNLAEAYFQLGDLISSQAIVQTLLESNPNNYRAKDLIQRINKLMK